MGFRQIEIPALDRVLSNIMAHPSSADPETHERGLDEYARLGGNCIHVHAEGEETHTRSATGRWLQRRGCQQEFFVCTQICHAGWDEAAARPIDRFTAAAVSEDIDADLDLLGTEFLDLVYLDDNPQSPFEPVVEGIGREIGLGRVRAFGVRNWDARRLAAAQEYLYAASLPRSARSLLQSSHWRLRRPLFGQSMFPLMITSDRWLKLRVWPCSRMQTI